MEILLKLNTYEFEKVVENGTLMPMIHSMRSTDINNLDVSNQIAEDNTTAMIKAPIQEDTKQPVQTSVQAPIQHVAAQPSVQSIQEETTNENTKVTKEMVRAIFTKIIKSGKQKEAKELTAKYGANKLPEVKEEDYTAIYKEAEGLI